MFRSKKKFYKIHHVLVDFARILLISNLLTPPFLPLAFMLAFLNPCNDSPKLLCLFLLLIKYGKKVTNVMRLAAVCSKTAHELHRFYCNAKVTRNYSSCPLKQARLFFRWGTASPHFIPRRDLSFMA
jgi:hypothetical protein